MGPRGMRRVNLRFDGAIESATRTIGALAYRARRKAATLALIVLTVPLGYKAIEGLHGWNAYHQEKIDSQKLDGEIQELKAKNQKLNENIKALRSDRNAIEREAREQLHYARPNDVVINIPQPAQAQPSASETAAKR